MALIKESKIDQVDNDLFEQLGGGREYKGVAKASIGRSGGLITIWNSNSINVSSSWDWEYGIAINGYSKEKEVFVCILNMSMEIKSYSGISFKMW